ncbi:MAG: sialate O-acetylesterase [Verrucomicrobia bacterium]|nr:MAG: sialate O-acetylesterase [Verrucomicrobiota bacterium]
MKLVSSMVLLAALGAAPAAHADVRLHRVFADHMVLQRDSNINVWGWAAPGEKVDLQFGGQNLSAITDDQGKWSVKLAPMKANATPRILSVAGKNKLELTDILVGDVWLCSGQSNMGVGFKRRNPPLDPGEMNLPNLRYLNIPNRCSVKPLEEAPGLQWTVSSPETVPTYASVPWYFGQMVHQQTGIPIGIIKANWGGAIAENWLAPDSMNDVAALSGLYGEFKNKLKVYEENLPRNTALLTEWSRAAQEALAKGLDVPSIPSVDMHPVYAPPGKPGYFCMYNGMISYLTGFPIKGVTWYQGESSADDGPIYYYKMLALITGWRKAWNIPQMPFYFVQLPNMGGAGGLPDASAKGWPLMREVQAKCLAIPNTGMAVTIDVGDEELHPRNKYDTGRRLAAIALAKDYGVKIEYQAPVYKQCEIKDDKVILSFELVGAGLMTGRKDGLSPAVEDPQAKLREFAIAGADKRFHAANALIQDGSVVVSSPEVPKPVAVRYAFTFNPAQRNLYGRNRLPVAPFRTDQW